jgi:type 1 glutamine amidotransferase
MRISLITVAMLVAIGFADLIAAETPAEETLNLYTRSRARAENSQHFDLTYKSVAWDARKTAVVVCDMWDKHWCSSATRRVGEMAPRMNEVLKAARSRGALIIHCPSGTMDFYKDTPQRKLAQDAPKVEPKVPLKGWCHLDPESEAPLPIDDSDGGCPEPDDKSHRAWSRQIKTLEIMPGDAITDSAEAYHLMRQRGIQNVILVGVHTNMCVLGRPFGIRQLVRQGLNVVLMRDMTDSMYNPKMRPKVSHIRGTELVVEHIEKYWCPTVTSSDLLGGPAFRFSEDKRPHVTILVSDDHYEADETLPEFGQMLREKHGCHVTVMHGQGTSNIPLTDELEKADCLVLYIRRLALPEEQLAAVRRYVDAGKPLVGMRTASHGFDVKGKSMPGQAEWPEFDAEVLGGNYHGHGPNDPGSDIRVLKSKRQHPILAGVEPLEWHSTGSLYNVSPLKDSDADVLMMGEMGDALEPITWTRLHNGGRVVYTALGHPDDFTQAQFRRMLVNSIFWAMGSAVE